MRANRRWSELSRSARVAVIVGAAVEVTLTAAAAADLARRPAAGVRGLRALWALGIFVQPVGPIAYLMLGRRPTT
jgi:hypothetical protein